MIVLSLFDGMSCGQIAFKELGIKVKYYASEIDKHAIKQTQLNFPDTIQLGDVTKWHEWDIKWNKIDILIGGSPCQGFSFAGKQLNFSDQRSKLFFIYVDILNHIKKVNPDVLFLLENVNMKKEYLRVISEYLGLFPVRINSNLVSAQNRDRLYWSNIKTKETGLFNELWTDIQQPDDRGILLKDILQPESEVDDKYYISEKSLKSFLDGKKGTLKSILDKSGCLTGGAHSGGNHSDMDYIIVTNIGRRIDENGIRKDYDSSIPYKREWQFNHNGKSYCLTSVQKDNLLTNGYSLRRLTPTECSRLQTIPEWYKWECSDTQCYKMLGNGWTIEVIKHIFSFINIHY